MLRIVSVISYAKPAEQKGTANFSKILDTFEKWRVFRPLFWVSLRFKARTPTGCSPVD
jgi:hypothetical protein